MHVLDKIMAGFPFMALAIGLLLPPVAYSFSSDAFLNTSFNYLLAYCGALLATGGWVWSSRSTRALARKTHAMNLLMHLREDYVTELKNRIYDALEQKKCPEPRDADRILGLYEFIAISVWNGTADEGIVRESQEFVFNRLKRGLRGYITEQQDSKNCPELYEYFLNLTKEWEDEAKKPLARTDGHFFKRRRATKK